MEEKMMKGRQSARITARLFTEEPWRSRGACRFADPELFFPVSDSGKSLEQAAEARAICAGCAVRRECLAFALRTQQAYGIWGGLTEQERRTETTGQSADHPAPRACPPPGPVAGAAHAPPLPGTPPLRGTVPFPRGHELFEAQAMATRIACQQVTGLALTAVRDSVNRACGLSARLAWERKATAHAELFGLLADAAGDYGVAAELRGVARLAHDLMLAAGPGADGMITSSRQRLLACLHAGDTDGAAMEMEDHLRVLRYMARLVRRDAAEESLA
jgi:WhiB family transcriptional regulator, redox-sensing transcriptional regulator